MLSLSVLVYVFLWISMLFPLRDPLIPWCWECWERKAVNAEDHTTICDVEELAYRRSKAEYAQRERERGTKNISIHKMQQLQNNNQPLQKVTKSLYIVTNLGQLPFMLFT